MEGNFPDIEKGIISGKRLRPLRGARPRPTSTPCRRARRRPLSGNVYIGKTPSIYMSKRPLIRITTDWTDLGNGYMIRVRPAPLRVVPLSSLRKTTAPPKMRYSGWIPCGDGAR